MDNLEIFKEIINKIYLIQMAVSILLVVILWYFFAASVFRKIMILFSGLSFLFIDIALVGMNSKSLPLPLLLKQNPDPLVYAAKNICLPAIGGHFAVIILVVIIISIKEKSCLNKL
jgi:hypothetical protein